jgi:alkylhydroperoxidase family enzyme
MSWTSLPDPRSLAPEAFAAWDDFTAQAAASAEPGVRALIAERVAVLFGEAAPAAAEPVEPAKAEAAREAVEQFLLDVSALSDAQRGAVAAAFGAGAYPFFQTVYAYDMTFRLGTALRQLFGAQAPTTPSAGEPAPGGDLWPATDRFLTVVAQLTALDPVLTEVVRLRGARAHDCRICQSRRDVRAFGDGVDESTFDKIDFYETSDLPEHAKVALRLTDAMVWTPARWPDGLVDQVRATFTPEQALEVVLDVVRNAANKVAVALKADEAVVTEGVEYFRLDPDGSLTYGLEAPVGAA